MPHTCATPRVCSSWLPPSAPPAMLMPAAPPLPPVGQAWPSGPTPPMPARVGLAEAGLGARPCPSHSQEWWWWWWGGGGGGRGVW